MRVCVFGAGAVGGHLAGRLAQAGTEVSVVARGAHLAAIQADGLRVETPEGLLSSRPAASDDPALLGPQDVVLVSVKAPALSQVASTIGPLLRPDTSVTFVMNGIPWWYFAGHGGHLEGRRLAAIDPGNAMWDAVGPDRAAGAVAHTACSIVSPGIVHVQNPRNRIVLGRPDGSEDPVLEAVVAAMCRSGLQAEYTDRIRDAVWEKLLMNLVGGSLGILTESAMGKALAEPAIAAAAETMAAEGAAIAEALGCNPGNPEEGLSRLKVSKHKQSILQDLLAGRSMELDALLRVPLELARTAGVPTPMLDLIIGLATQRAKAAQLYS